MRVYSGGVEQWRPLVELYFTEVERALCVMEWESGGDPDAISPTQDYGLMQIHAPLWAAPYGVSWNQLLIPETNVSIAASILANQGWTAWSAVKRGKC